MSNPHDTYFRRVLGEPRNAASALRAILPPTLTARLDLDGLTPVPGSYVDQELRWRHTDLLFSTRLDGRDGFVYVLVEHQSRSDPLMPFRMLRYMVLIWQDYLKNNPTARRLPAVLPVVVHRSRENRAWSAPTELLELIDLDPMTADAAMEFLPRFRFLLDDLAVIDVQALQARPLEPPALMLLVLLKIAPDNPHLGEDIQPWAEDLRAVLAGPHGVDDFITIVTYIQTVSEITDEDLRPLFDQLGPQAKEAYVTTAERLRAEGEARGQAKTLVQLLTIKFGPQPRTVTDAVHAATTEQLTTWTARILTAVTIDEVLG